MFEQAPAGQTPEQQKEAEDAAKKQAEEAEKKEIDTRKNRLKTEGESIYSFAGKLASKIPAPDTGMSRKEFDNWLEGFTEGWVGATPDPADTPYEMPRTQRPRVRIVSEGK